MRRLLLVVNLVLVICGSDAKVRAEEWTRFRGPNGTGVSDATTVPERWTADDYNWQVDLPGVGHSAPVIWKDSIYLTSGDKSTGIRFVLAVRTTTGERAWTKEFPAQLHAVHADNSLASGTPAVDARGVYAAWATPEAYTVVALDHAGAERWRVDLGPFRNGHGFGVSPIVVDDVLVVPNEQDGESTVLGLDTATGETRWKTPRKAKATYSTPCLWQPPGGAPELIFTNWTHGFSALDPKTGAVKWELDAFDKSHVETSIGSPIVAGDLVLGVCGWLGHGNEVVAVRPPKAGADKTSAAETAAKVYRIDRGAPLCTTPLVKDGLLYLWSDVGIVTCADAVTGDVHWRKRVGQNYYSSPVCVGERIYNVSVTGDVVVLKTGREYEKLAEIQLGEGSHSTPAVAAGVLYLRTFSKLFSIGGKK